MQARMFATSTMAGIGIVLLALGACSERSVPDVIVAGSSTVQPILEIAGPRYEALHPDVRVQVQGGGSSIGISASRLGLAHIGMVSRALERDESADLTATKIGDDGIGIIVHSDNAVAQLSRDDVVRVYTGAVTSWQKLGGPEAPITVINKEEGRATLELFEKHFDVKDRFVKGAVIIGPNGQAIATIASNPNAIAYVSIGAATRAAAQGAPIRLLHLDGIAATTANVNNGTYSLKRPLMLTTKKGVPAGHVRGLVDFMLSPEGQRIVAEQGFVPIGPTS